MRSVVITGTSSGIGWGTAKVLIANGLRVFGSVRKTSDAERLEAEFGERFVPLLFDVTDEAAVKAAAADVRSALAGQRLTGLVNNAGVAVAGPLLELPTEEFRRQIDINLIGVVIAIKAFAPLIGTDPRLTGPPGRIVNIGSVGGQIGNPFVAPYNASKFALEGCSESLRRGVAVVRDRRHRCCARRRATPIWSKAEQRRHRALSRHAVCSGAAAFAKLHAGTRREGFAAEKIGEAVLHALTAAKPQRGVIYVVAAPDQRWLARNEAQPSRSACVVQSARTLLATLCAAPRSPRPAASNQDVSITVKDATGRAKTTAASRGATRGATSVQVPPAAFELAPIFPSLPRKSRMMLARCMIHSSTDSSRNNWASCTSPYHHRNIGVAALAISAASDE